HLSISDHLTSTLFPYTTLFRSEDRAGKDVPFLAQNVKTFLDAARKRPELGTLIPTFLPNVPQVFVKVDRDKVIKQGIDLASVYQDRKSTRLNSSRLGISYAVFC